jgi:hypothetical protein
VYGWYANDDTSANLGYGLAMPTFTVEQVSAARAFLAVGVAFASGLMPT